MRMRVLQVERLDFLLLAHNRGDAQSCITSLRAQAHMFRKHNLSCPSIQIGILQPESSSLYLVCTSLVTRGDVSAIWCAHVQMSIREGTIQNLAHLHYREDSNVDWRRFSCLRLHALCSQVQIAPKGRGAHEYLSKLFKSCTSLWEEEIRTDVRMQKISMNIGTRKKCYRCQELEEVVWMSGKGGCCTCAGEKKYLHNRREKKEMIRMSEKDRIRTIVGKFKRKYRCRDKEGSAQMSGNGSIITNITETQNSCKNLELKSKDVFWRWMVQMS